MMTKAVISRPNWAASPPAVPATSKPASSTSCFDRAMRARTLSAHRRPGREWRRHSLVEQTLDPAVLGHQLLEEGRSTICPIAVAIPVRCRPARSDLAGEHRERRFVIDIVPFVQRSERHTDLSGPGQRLPEDSLGAPVDLLEKPSVKPLQPDQVIAAVGGWPEDDTIARTLEPANRLHQDVR